MTKKDQLKYEISVILINNSLSWRASAECRITHHQALLNHEYYSEVLRVKQAELERLPD